MIKSITHVVLLVVLSFGVMAAGVSPTIRTELQATLNSTGAALSTMFTGNAGVQGSVDGSAVTGNTSASANAGLGFNNLIQAGVRRIDATFRSGTRLAANTRSTAGVTTSDSLAVGSGATNATVNTGIGATGSATNGNISASANAQAGASAGIARFLSLDALFHNQLHANIGVSK